ncbi:protein FAR1-RELATED SEQUENCE 5-like [Arachis hypogaea]|uniref:protein FAR1-RELATED SEQUENCE 5-like n=1 Tax=Arachis hypogaea TaxID=3818 RepID=UPI003B222A1F
MDHFVSSLFLQDENVRADNDPLAWEDIEGCRVSENYAEEVQGVDSNVDKFFNDTFYDNWDERAFDGIDELGYMNLKEITASEVRLLHFRDQTVAFSFYQLYSKMNGFAVRKNRIRRNVKNEVTQQQFICFWDGFRDTGPENDSHRRKCEPKPEPRCGCLAEMRVHTIILFGDVLAFDATYCKNRYMCPLVVFSRVNHHNQTIVFAAMLVANEKEETYTWLLKQFLEAMKGKAPGCVITDGDNAMKKAIESVFPSAYYRLCAWHLLRNATSNLSNPTFTSEFKKCMLFYYEISEFEDWWVKLVTELGLQHNEWVCDLYARRKMWATAYIHGHFFGGFRTTSRCERLHSMLSKFVHSRHNLRGFIEQILRCICQMRLREAQSELASVVGDLVLQSPLHALERSAANTLTREIFMLFRPMLTRACTLKVCSCTLTPSCEIYTLSKSGNPNKEWNVSHYQDRSIFKCSCFRMESLGIPCDHIVAVLVHLDAKEIPKSLLIDRWSKNARLKVWEFMENGPFCWES